MNTYPLTKHFVSGTLPVALNILVDRLINKYPALSENRAKEIAAAYMWINFKKEMDRMSDNMDNTDTDSLARMANDHPATFQSEIMDASGSRSLLLDEYEIENYSLPFPLTDDETEITFPLSGQL